MLIIWSVLISFLIWSGSEWVYSWKPTREVGCGGSWLLLLLLGRTIVLHSERIHWHKCIHGIGIDWLRLGLGHLGLITCLEVLLWHSTRHLWLHLRLHLWLHMWLHLRHHRIHVSLKSASVGHVASHSIRLLTTWLLLLVLDWHTCHDFIKLVYWVIRSRLLGLLWRHANLLRLSYRLLIWLLLRLLGLRTKIK